MTVILSGDFAKHWNQADAFEKVAALEGDTIRQKEGRRTLRFQFEGETYYVKHHRGIGWGEIFKSYGQLKAPVTSARNEWEAIHRLRDLGVPTLTPVAYGIRGKNPAKIESFIITRELRDTLSLAKHTDNWPLSPPGINERIALTQVLARDTATMHGAGINHRDLYICHFLMQLGLPVDKPVLYVVDLHRAQCRDRVPKRWLVKDLASIYFSAMNIGLTKRDVLRFMRLYFAMPLKQIFATQSSLLHAINAKAMHLYQRDFKQPSPQRNWWN